MFTQHICKRRLHHKHTILYNGDIVEGLEKFS